MGRSPLFDLSPGPMPEGFEWQRVEGMMLALAVGDALGNTSEGMVPWRRYSDHGEIRDYPFDPRTQVVPEGRPSDDTQLSFWTLEQMIADEGFVPDRVAARFCRDRIYGAGSTVKRFAANYRSGTMPWHQCGPKSAGNGGLMRIAPMVIPHLRTGTPDLWVDTALSAMITHNDSASIAACLAFVRMLWELLQMPRPPRPEWWLETFVALAKDLEIDDSYTPRGGDYVGQYRGSLWQFVEDKVAGAYRRGETVREACDSWHSGAYLLETVPSVLLILMRHGDNLEEAIVRAVNDTYDNDTCAAIVGAAVGALHGRANIPEDWLWGLYGCTARDDYGQVYRLLRRARRLWWDPGCAELPALQEAFADAWAKEGIELSAEDVAARRRGEIDHSGTLIQWLFGSEAGREYLDMYAYDRISGEAHLRIWDDGRIEHLETPWDIFYYDPRIHGDRESAWQKYLEHNRRVFEVLRQKGFY